MGIEQSIVEVLQKHLDQKIAELETHYRNKVSQIERDYVTDRYYTTKEAAIYLSVTDTQLAKWVREGQIRRYNFGNKMYRFRRSELDTFAAASSARPSIATRRRKALFIEESESFLKKRGAL